MGRLFMLAIMLYLLFLACYLIREQWVKRRRNAARRKRNALFASPPPEDIMGKSGFDLRHSLPQATTLEISEKPTENDSTFADGNEETAGQTSPAAIPTDRLDRAFSSAPADDPGDIDLVIDDGPDEETDGYEENVDTAESEDAEDGGDMTGGTAMATGVGFTDLSGMARTVDNPDAATRREKEEAGRVLVEVRQTDLFEQVVSGRPEKRATAGRLMDDYLAAWRRRKRETGEGNDEPAVKAPDNFDARAFAGQ